MKHDDLLLEATRALRDELADDAPPPSGRQAPASLTRGRIMQSLRDNRRKRATRLTWIIPLAAVFIGGTAWATAGGYTRVVTEMTALFGGSSKVDPPPADPTPPTGPLARAESSPVEDVAPPVEEVPPPEELPLPEPPPPSDPPSLAKSVASPPVDAALAADPGRALYEKAHHAHFVDKNPSAALTAWETYLAKAPGGPFATEATYNRALCLVRLGRTEQAKAALTPFAEGKYGAYRQSEAKQLLEALGP